MPRTDPAYLRRVSMSVSAQRTRHERARSFAMTDESLTTTDGSRYNHRHGFQMGRFKDDSLNGMLPIRPEFTQRVGVFNRASPVRDVLDAALPVEAVGQHAPEVNHHDRTRSVSEVGR